MNIRYIYTEGILHLDLFPSPTQLIISMQIFPGLVEKYELQNTSVARILDRSCLSCVCNMFLPTVEMKVPS